MAYVKPGVLITQVQETVSPALTTPDLYATVVGRPYYNFKPGDVVVSDYWNATYMNSVSVDLNALYRAQYPSVSGVIDEYSIYVDLIGISGLNAGEVFHMDFDNSDPANGNEATYSADTLVINSGTSTTYAGGSYRIRPGFRVIRGDLQQVTTFEGGSDIQSSIGPTTVFNELGTALTIAAANSVRKTYAYGNTAWDNHTAALEALESAETYALAPLTYTWSQIQTYETHADSMSLPASKKERIVIGCPDIPWTSGDPDANSTEKGTTANDIASRAAITANRRVTMVHPNVCYIREKLHISQIKQRYLANTLDDPSGSFYSTNNLYCLLTGNVTLTDGTKYYKDQEITDTRWTAIEADGINELTVLVPVPGFHLAAAVAGQVSGEVASQSHTNLPIVGIERVKYSSDFYSEDNLNTMAAGGTYIMKQDTLNLPIYCRHQLTTDTTSIESRELSIRKAIDYVAKYLRRNTANLIGRYNITDAYLANLRVIINSIGLSLVKKGVVRDMKLQELYQSPTEPDRVYCKVRVLTLYPANYIEIDLIY